MMDYSFYLFVRLYMDVIGTDDMPYDTEYEFMVELYNEYNDSDYVYDPKQGEYECMLNFIKTKQQ